MVQESDSFVFGLSAFDLWLDYWLYYLIQDGQEINGLQISSINKTLSVNIYLKF